MFGWIKDSAVYEAGLIGSGSWDEESSSYKVQLPAEVLQEAARVMDKGYLFYVHGTIEAEGTESEFYLRANKMEANRILFAEGSSLTEGLLTISYFDLTHVETEVADLMNDVTDLQTALTDKAIGFSPESYFTKQILCPDFEETAARRTWTKVNNTIEVKSASSSTNAESYVIFFTGSEHAYVKAGGDVAVPPTTNQLVDIARLKPESADRQAVIDYYVNGNYTGVYTSGFYIYFCKLVDDVITVVSNAKISDNINFLSRKKEFYRYVVNNIPEDATHFALGMSGGSSTAAFTLSVQIAHAIEENPKTKTATVFGYDLPTNATKYFGLSSDYLTVFQNARDAWMADYSGDAQKIPFVLHTDQHGQIKADTKGFFDLLGYMLNWDEISTIFNLGDTVLDHWSDSTVTTNPLDRNRELENALVALENIPLAKQINVFGNHDTWYSGDVETTVHFTLPSLKYLNPYFKTNGLRTVRLPDNSGNMVVYDDNNRVRYLVIGDWDYADRATKNYQYFYINKAHWEWIIKELSTDCGYDIVIVSHVPLKMYGTGSYNPITSESIAGTEIYISYGNSDSAAVFGARKAKTSGSITVGSDTVTYDFTNCTDNILCAISGHTHVDGVDRVGDLLSVCFDRFGPTYKQIHFGLIDRANQKIKVWKVLEGETPEYQHWEAPFDAT